MPCILPTELGIVPVVVSEMKRDINPVNDGKAYQKIKDLIEKFKPDVVHTHAAKSGVIGRMAAEACNVPVIVHTFHGHVFHSYFSEWKTRTFIHIERYLARRSTGIVAISPSQKHELADIYRICPEEKIEIIPLGLDLDKFRTNQNFKRAQFRKQYQIEEDEIAIGIIGRIVPIKNHSLFVAAAARLRALTSRKLKFVIIGDGDMRSQMEAEFRAAQIDYSYYPEHPEKTTAICTSWLTDMDEVLAGLDIIALTSHNEGTPVSLIEAQAASRPVVSTNVGGVADVVNDQYGFITPPGDVGRFAEALLKLVNNAELRARFGAYGQQSVLGKYSYHRLVDDMSSYYYRLMNKRNGIYSFPVPTIKVASTL